jgi:tetratricopeptide (TPR) repeat protein
MMIRVHLCAVLLGGLAATSAPSPAQAQPAGGAPSAKQYVDQGIAAQERGDYDAAIELYTKANALSPHPLLIYNLAQAHRLAGRLDKALELYNKYLVADPDGPQASNARGFVSELQAKIAAARPPAPAPEPGGVEPGVAGSAPGQQSSISATTDAPPGRGLRLAGIAAGAGGVIMLGVGIGFAIHGASLSDQIEKQYVQRKYDEGQRANTLAAVGLISGSVLVVAGAGMYWWSYRAERSGERVSVVPMVSAHIAGLAVSGSMW